MRSLRIAALASFLLVMFGFVAFSPTAALADGNKGAKGGAHKPIVNMLHHSHAIIVHAWKAAKKGGADKDDLRKAWVHQLAARSAAKADHPALAARLTLRARVLARKVIHENKEEPTKEEAADSAEETKAAEGATDADADAASAEAEKTAPSTDDLMKTEPTEGA